MHSCGSRHRHEQPLCLVESRPQATPATSREQALKVASCEQDSAGAASKPPRPAVRRPPRPVARKPPRPATRMPPRPAARKPPRPATRMPSRPAARKPPRLAMIRQRACAAGACSGRPLAANLWRPACRKQAPAVAVLQQPACGGRPPEAGLRRSSSSTQPMAAGMPQTSACGGWAATAGCHSSPAARSRQRRLVGREQAVVAAVGVKRKRRERRGAYLSRWLWVTVNGRGHEAAGREEEIVEAEKSPREEKARVARRGKGAPVP
ncbi:translation initiation factor IF-2-like [Zingiber officinale]|uniref:translation initiation factor IF-2-like n=1 Tax=Zingiber officinale TaxID=94328 RepID=UPI001C4CBC23|nr:translation initiation factor IF-2-like [Zingiber officinale]